MNIEQEADALEALEAKAVLEAYTNVDGPDYIRYKEEIVRRGMPLIRALIERVRALVVSREVVLKERDREICRRVELQASLEIACDERDEALRRIASLEAERDIWKERALSWTDVLAMKGPRWADPAPSEIAARVAERKARTP